MKLNRFFVCFFTGTVLLCFLDLLLSPNRMTSDVLHLTVSCPLENGGGQVSDGEFQVFKVGSLDPHSPWYAVLHSKGIFTSSSVWLLKEELRRAGHRVSGEMGQMGRGGCGQGQHLYMTVVFSPVQAVGRLQLAGKLRPAPSRAQRGERC